MQVIARCLQNAPGFATARGEYARRRGARTQTIACCLRTALSAAPHNSLAGWFIR